MSQTFRKTCKCLNYVENLLISVSAVTGFVVISTFLSLVPVPICITSSAIWFKICVITARIKKYKSIIRRKHAKIVLLGNN